MENIAAFFRAEKKSKQEAGKKEAVKKICFMTGLFFNPESGGDIFFETFAAFRYFMHC